jgi:hypothetical protein
MMQLSFANRKLACGVAPTVAAALFMLLDSLEAPQVVRERFAVAAQVREFVMLRHAIARSSARTARLSAFTSSIAASSRSIISSTSRRTSALPGRSANVLTSAFLDLHKAQAVIREKPGQAGQLLWRVALLALPKGSCAKSSGASPVTP